MRQKRVPLEDIQAAPEEHLEFMTNPQATLGDLLQEIQHLTGLTYQELAPYFGYSGAHLARLARGRTHQQSPAACAQVARTTQIPFQRIVYASAIGALPESERDEIAYYEGQVEDKRLENGYYREIVLMSDSFADVASVEALREEIDRHATTQEHTRTLPVLGPNRLIVQMTHKHMQYRPEPGQEAYMPPRGSSIPLDALLEVELVDADEPIEDGEVVLVQLMGEAATFYEYEAIRDSKRRTVYEIYHAYDRCDGVTRVVHHDPNHNQPAEDRRRIIGRVLRLVDADVGAVSAH